MIIELSEQEQLRRQSLKALRELGINPYPAARFEVNASAQEIAQNFDAEKGNYQEVSIAGRIMSRRDMGKANWDHVNAEANLTMTKEDVAGANVYSITLTMYAGDMFQICFGGNWDGQVGIGLFEGAEYCDGVNFYDNMTYTAADKKVAQVKNADGEVVFIGSDEYNKGYEVWNAKLAEGMDGKYKITYTTYPNAGAYNKITFEQEIEINGITYSHVMMVNDLPCIFVPANRMKTSITIQTGRDDQADGGIVAGEEAKNIHAVVVAHDVPLAISKVDSLKQFGPEENQLFDGTAIQARYLYDLVVPSDKVITIGALVSA